MSVSAALDGVIASPCGTSLHLDGWFIDPADAVQQLLVLLHNGDQFYIACPVQLAPFETPQSRVDGFDRKS